MGFLVRCRLEVEAKSNNSSQVFYLEGKAYICINTISGTSSTQDS